MELAERAIDSVMRTIVKKTDETNLERCRPRRGLANLFCIHSQVSASLHPGLYAAARCAGSARESLLE